MGVYRTGSASAAVLTTNTGAAITSPVTAAAGEVIINTLVTRSASATITTLNGWQILQTVAMTNGTAWLLGRVAAGAESSWASCIVSASSQQQQQVMGIFQGVTLPASFDATTSTSGSGSTSPVTMAAMSGGVNGGAAVGLIGMSRGGTITWATWTEDTDANTGTGTTNSTLSAAHVILSANGNTPTASITESTAGNAGWGAVVLPPLTTGPQIRQQIDNAVSGAAAISLTLSAAQVGDTVYVLHADNFHTAAELTTPTGTAVGGGWQLKHTLDGGTNDNHCKVWQGTVTTAGGTVVEGTVNTDHERYLGAWVFAGTVSFDTAASTDSDATSTSHVAPSVTPASQTDDTLICLWGTLINSINYTIPASMIARTERDAATFGTYRGADEKLASAAATGTRTATASATDNWFAVSVLVATAGGAVVAPQRPKLSHPSYRR